MHFFLFCFIFFTSCCNKQTIINHFKCGFWYLQGSSVCCLCPTKQVGGTCCHDLAEQLWGFSLGIWRQNIFKKCYSLYWRSGLPKTKSKVAATSRKRNILEENVLASICPLFYRSADVLFVCFYFYLISVYTFSLKLPFSSSSTSTCAFSNEFSHWLHLLEFSILQKVFPALIKCALGEVALLGGILTATYHWHHHHVSSLSTPI